MVQRGYRNLTLNPRESNNSITHAAIAIAAQDGNKGVQDSPNRLTRREQDVLALIAEGRTTKEIAAHLKIAFKTAVCHRSHLMEKTGSRNSVTLILYAIRQGLIDPESS